MASGVLLTRLLPPRLPSDCLPRTALVTRLVEGLAGRLVAVVAGAGYGKSTVVAQAIQQSDLPCVWLSCDERLGGAPDLLAHLTAGIGRIIPGFGARLVLDGHVGNQVRLVCNELVATAPEDLILVLDDVHLLDPSATKAVAELVRDLPPSVHLVLAGRAPLDYSPGKLRAGLLLTIGEDDLVLSEGEVATLWTGASNRDGDAETARRIHERTEGWMTGVILAAQAGHSALEHHKQSELFAYLAEEVFLSQPRLVQDFVLQTSVLEHFSADLAGALTGVGDPRGMCQRLFDRHLFVIRLDADGTWYRYHHLFRAFLRDRVAERQPELGRELERRAAAAWIDAGLAANAIDHLLAADEFEQAADLINSVADEMRIGPQAEVLTKWINVLPEQFHAGRPALRLARAIGEFSEGKHEQGFTLVELVLDDFIAGGDHERAAAAFFALIYMQLVFGTRQRFAIDVGLRQLPRIDETASMLPASMVLMASELGCATRYDDAEEMLGRILRLRLPKVDPLGQGYLASARALFIDHPHGRSKQALATIEWILDLFERNRRYDTLGYVLAIHAYRIILFNHLGRFDDALAALDRMVECATRLGVIAGADRSMTKFRAVALAGLERWDELEVVLALGEPVDQMRGSSYGYRLRAPAARLAAHRGDVATVAHHCAAVMDFVDAVGFSFDAPGWICDIAVAAWQVGLHSEATRLRQEVLDGAQRAQSPWSQARGQLLGAELLSGPAADACLIEALELTDQFGFDEIWTRRDRLLAGRALAQAIDSGLGPPGLACRLAIQAGGEVLERCVSALVGMSEHGRSCLGEAFDAAGLEESELRHRLMGGRPGAQRSKHRAPHQRPPLSFHALGGFSVRRGGDVIPVSAFGRERARALLGVLICAGGAVHRDRLLEWLWPELDPVRGLRALHVTLHALRRALEPELGRGSAGESVVRAEGESYRLATQNGDTVDVVQFLQLVRSNVGDPPSADFERLRMAERSYGGPLYPEWPYAEWSVECRREIEQGYMTVLEGLGEHLTAAGDYREAALRFDRLVQINPEREVFHRLLMATYARAGEKALALRQYHACRSVLRRELGVEASSETRALYQLILEEKPIPAELHGIRV